MANPGKITAQLDPMTGLFIGKSKAAQDQVLSKVLNNSGDASESLETISVGISELPSGNTLI